MCNLYSLTRTQHAMRALFRVTKDLTGNLPPMPGVFPDYPAPIVRIFEGERELTTARWGMPSPAFALKGRTTDPGITNVRNTASPHWRRWLGPANRCIVPFTSFSEYETGQDGKKSPIWFALGEDRPLACFAGIWTTWTSVRKAKEGEVTCDLFAFLTTEANAEVAPTHPKAMPVILADEGEVDVWLNAPTPVAMELQRPLANGLLKVVSKGERTDAP
ncbi:SOS response-associated peptidase [Rhodoblastus sp. 17X3]|uniref:SOS response-associated peptidase n=1 Tax=Rhodoblastus sp. 17X3 TaxID=3047026 RepID=UPI0024B80CE2|nr:SOS response-associated peptidase [Rhodoblastus sp. 17X3]MDI9846745.1 SOS response-associated peptidase [Rhodoblastus sp. 17X3]